MADVNVGMMLSTTLKNYRKTLTDNIFNSNAIFYLLKKNGVLKTESGGERIVEPLMYAKNDTAKSYSGYDILDTTPQEGIDSAEFNWKQYSVSVTISGEEQRKNKGNKYKIIDILDARTQQAEMSLTSALVSGIFSDGTGNNNKDLTGLKAMVSDSGTYGGINSSTYAFWRAYVDNSTNALTLPEMRTAFNSVSLGGKDTPDLIVTTQAIFETYEGLFTNVAVTGSNARAGDFMTPSESQKKVADGGFQTLAFKGTPITYDEDATTGAMYMLNTKHMKMVVHEDANFETTEFVKPENQDALVAQILFMGNLTCNRRKSFALLSNKS